MAKPMTIAAFKKACDLSKKSFQGWDYMSIKRSIDSNVKAGINQGEITKAQGDSIIAWGNTVLNSMKF